MKVIVISGGSDGLGKTLAERLSENNKVIILSPSKEKLEQVANEIKCDYEVCDVSDYISVESAIKEVVKNYGRIDCLINNAGLWIQEKLVDNDYNKIKKVIDVNTTGVIYLTKAVIPYMTEQKDGLIINIISQAGIYAKAERSVYHASKWAITGFTKSIQSEVSKDGIRVTGLYPGMLKTNMFEKEGIKKDMSKGLDTKEVATTVEFLINLDKNTVIPEIGIKHILN